MGKLERDFQGDLIPQLKKMFPNCFVLKNDPNYRQGIPDLTILWGTRWGMLEVKKSASEPYRPNQEIYLEMASEQSWSATIYPENKDEVLEELYHFMTRP